MKKNSIDIKEALFDNKTNLVLTVCSLVIYLTVFVIWHYFLRQNELFISSINGVYPIRYLTIILPLNYFLGIFSYRKEKEISYLLFGAGLFIAVLMLILEVFYLVNLNNV